MSMLSAQIDGLRSCADLYDGTTKPEMAKELQRPHLAQELREAADTIWQLRDDLQRAITDNAKLRNLVADMLGYYAMPNSIDYKRESALLERARELGVEVDE